MRTLRELSRRRLRTAPDRPRDRAQTVVLLTHDPDVGAATDRIIRMRDGLVVADERVARTALAAA